MDAFCQRLALRTPPNDLRLRADGGLFLAGGAVDHDRLGFALDGDGGQFVIDDVPLAGLVGGRAAQDRIRRGLHQARRQVDHVANHGVFTPHAAANRAAKRLPGGNADGTAHIEFSQGILNFKRHERGAGGVIFVSQRRQTERGHQRDAFIVHTQFVDGAFIVIERLLHPAHDGLGLLQRQFLAEIGQVDKQHRNPPQLCQPVGADDFFAAATGPLPGT